MKAVTEPAQYQLGILEPDRLHQHLLQQISGFVRNLERVDLIQCVDEFLPAHGRQAEVPRRLEFVESDLVFSERLAHLDRECIPINRSLYLRRSYPTG